MSTSHHGCAHLSLLLKTNGQRQAHIMLLMKTQGCNQVCPAHPMGTSSHRKPCRVLAQKCKGMDVASAETTGTLLLIPSPESVRELTSKQTVELSPSGGQVGIAARQRRPLMRGK